MQLGTRGRSLMLRLCLLPIYIAHSPSFMSFMHYRRYVVHGFQFSTVEADSEYIDLLIDVLGFYRPIDPLPNQNALEEVYLPSSACATC